MPRAAARIRPETRLGLRRRGLGPDPASDLPWFKDPAPFIEHDGKSLEARLESMQGLITPNRLFFVRNNSVSLDLDVSRTGGCPWEATLWTSPWT